MKAKNGKKRILIVDDECSIADLIAEFCRSFGFETLVINKGEDVVDAAESFLPDLITMDLVMPDVNGIEIMERLRLNEKTRNIPVIVISSVAESHSLRGVMEDLSLEFIKKPIQMDYLRTTIQRVLM